MPKYHLSTSGKFAVCKADKKACPRRGDGHVVLPAEKAETLNSIESPSRREKFFKKLFQKQEAKRPTSSQESEKERVKPVKRKRQLTLKIDRREGESSEGYIDSIAPLEAFQDAVEKVRITAGEHPDPDVPYLILNYGKSVPYERDWDEVTLASRGLIVNQETGEIVARPFKKFFNYGEPNTDFSTDGPVVVSQKEDGQLAIGYRLPDGTYQISTRGSMFSEMAVDASKLYQSKYAGQWEGEKDTEHTYLFETISPQHRIVLDYGDKEDLILLGAVNNKTGRSIPLTEIDELGGNWPGPRAPIHPHSSFAEAVKAPVPPDQEGVVIHFTDNDQRLKIKGEEYLRLHRSMHSATPLTVWEALATKGRAGLDNWAADVPDEFFDQIKSEAAKLEHKQQGFVAEIKEEVQKAKEKAKAENWGKKQLALHMQNSKHPFREQIIGTLFSNNERRLEDWAWKQVKPKGKTNFDKV